MVIVLVVIGGQGVRIDARMDSIPPPAIREGVDNRGNWNSQNTGPKGVKADFEEAKLNLQTIRMRQRMERDRALKHNGTVQYTVDEAPKAEPARRKRPDSDSETDSDLESDDEEFARYKLERLKMIEASLPNFGTFDRVDKDQMAAIIHDTHELCFVVVHWYQNHHTICTALNLCFESLAPQFPRTRFIRYITYITHLSSLILFSFSDE